MDVPPPNELLDLVRALPAAKPLLERLGERPGIYLVGGAVRDLLLGGAPDDLDLVVEGDAASTAHGLGEDVVIHDRFGTSTIRAGGHLYDLARSRREHYSRPGALPDVEPARIEEDLLRRDFTVNAMALALGPPNAGELKTAPTSLDDLAGRRLRVLHDRSFIDDPTRLLRLIMYASRLRFEVEIRTRALAEGAVHQGTLGSVSGPRVGNELRLLAAEPDPVSALAALQELELDRALHPRFGLRDEVLARGALELLPADGRRELLALAAASENVPAGELRQLLDALAFEAGDRDVIVAAATSFRGLAEQVKGLGKPSDVQRALARATPEAAALAGAAGPADEVRHWLDKLRHVRLEIGGEDLLAAGIPRGPAIGNALRETLAAKLDGVLAGREEELQMAVRLARGKL